MSFVRYVNNAVVQVSRWPLNGAVELPDNHADILAFKARHVETPNQKVDGLTSVDPLWNGLVGLLAKQFGLTREAVIASLKSERS